MPRTKKIKREVASKEVFINEEIVPLADEVPVGESIWRKLARWITVISVSLIPVIFIPGMFPISFIVQETVIAILALIGVLCLLMEVLQKKRLFFSPGSVAVFAFLAIFMIGATASLVLSPSFQLSFWGAGYPEGITALTLIVGISLFFLGSHLFTERKDLFLLGKCLAVSFGVGMIFSVISTISVLYAQQPFLGIVVGGFNLLGSTIAFSVFAGMIFFFTMFVLSYFEHKLLRKVLLSLLGIASFFLLLLTGSQAVLIVSAITLALFSVFRIFGKREEEKMSQKETGIIIFCILATIVMGSYGYRFNTFLSLVPPEVAPSLTTSVSIATRTLQANPQTFLFGSGPNTYAFDYVRFRPLEVNLSSFGDIDLQASYSLWLTLLPIVGVVGSLGLLAVCLILLGRGISFFLKKSDDVDYVLRNGILLITIYLSLSSLVYSFTFGLVGYWFFCLGLLLGFSGDRDLNQKSFSFETATRSFIGSFVVIVKALVLGILIFFLGQRIGSFSIINSTLGSRENSNQTSIENVTRAYEIFPHENTARILSSLWFSEVVSNTRTASSSSVSLAQEALNSTLYYAQEAVRLNSTNHQNPALLGEIYRNILSAQGALEGGILAYKEAEQLHPTNSSYPLILGHLHLIKAEAVTSSDAVALRSAAENYLRKAVYLKPDNYEAYLVLAETYQKQGRVPEAISILEAVTAQASQFLNARLFLASLYKEAGKIEEARVQLQEALKIDPENEEIQAELKTLSKEK